MADPVPAVAPAAPAPGASPAPAPTPAARSPAARAPAPSGGIGDQEFDRLPASEQGRYARTRDANNNSQWTLRSDDPGSAKPAVAAGEPPGPASVVDGRLVVGDMTLSADDVKMLMAQKAESDLRKTQTPQSADAYETKLPDGFRLPEGVAEFKFNEADPALVDFRRFAHSKGIDQQTFSEMLGFYASSEAQKEAAFRAAQAAEVAKLGANGTSRVTAVETWLRSTLGDELANSMRPMIVTSRIVEGFEKLASKQFPAANFSQAHRTPEPPSGAGRVSDEEYGRMSQAERWEYARSFDQTQFRNNGGGAR